MAEFYSMEEAARVLGIGLDELKNKIQSGELRQIGGAASPQFRKTDIDEYARRQGLGSDPDMNSDLSLDDLDFSDLFIAPGDSGAKASPVAGSGVSQAAGISTTSQEINPLGAASGVTPGASDIQVVKVAPQGSSDSDIRIVPDAPARKVPSDSDVTLLSADSAVLDLSNLDIPGKTEKPGDTALGTVEMGSSGEIPLLDEDSDFDLTPSGVIDALRPESGSDFELAALDSSSEFEVLGTQSASDIPAKPAGSGVNLSKPNDSGIGLADFDADSIELAPIDEAAPAKKTPEPPASSKPVEAKPSDTGISAASSFEDTDFQIDDFSDSGDDFAGATADRTIEFTESSADIEIIDGSGDISIISSDESPLFDEPMTAKAGAAAKASKGESLLDDSSGWETTGESDELSDSSDVKPKTAAKPAPALVRAGTPTEWGTPWVVGLCFSTAMMLLLCMVTFDLLRNLYEFRGDTPVASGLVKQIAGLIGGK